MRHAPPTSASTDLAKAAMRRLARQQLEPTPANFAQAYAQESGEPRSPGAADAPAPVVPLAEWIDRVVRGLERGGRYWTTGRKKDSLGRVLAGGQHDVARLQRRLGHLLSAWDRDEPDTTLADQLDAGIASARQEQALPAAVAAHPEPQRPEPSDADSAPVALSVPTGSADGLADRAVWGELGERLGGTVRCALPQGDPVSDALAEELASLLASLRAEGADPSRAAAVTAVCGQAERIFEHRHRLIDLLGQLCSELTSSLTDLAEDDSWARGQGEAMRAKIDEGLTPRGVRSVSELLRNTRHRQGQLRREREKARLALKSFVHQMLGEVGELGQQTGRFHHSVGRYAEVIAGADTLESLAGVVQEMVRESRTVESLVGQAQQRLEDEHARASALSVRVDTLEAELRRLSDEVSTDQLTQVANRRGLMALFETERARHARSGGLLGVALLDVDNFKRLNDELGHGVGDVALRSLAALVKQTLRPTDHVTRYGGEEFVLLLPETSMAEAEQVMNRVQRALTGGLFLHENKKVFVTFSAGITAYRDGEPLETALDRADLALYEAKRTGKNRSCVA